MRKLFEKDLTLPSHLDIKCFTLFYQGNQEISVEGCIFNYQRDEKYPESRNRTWVFFLTGRNANY